MNKKIILLFLTVSFFTVLHAQTGRWQQRVKYTMEVDVDVEKNKLFGKQKLEYTNNSPDTLDRVFYHLYWNAFQPNSMMDVRSQELGKISIGGSPDWDRRVRDRISHLKEDEIGYQKIKSLKMNGAVQNFKVHETILEVKLSKPILPKTTVTFDMEFESQVPVQIRRAGRDAANGVRYSMSQWFPKMSEYDYMGWNPNPYIAREFHGVWGDFDVKISIDRNYILGGTGYLQNAQEIGYGYEKPGTTVKRPSGKKLTWHFIAPDVHDFFWAADPDYKHLSKELADGTTIHVLYDRNEEFLKERFNSLRPQQKENYKNDFKNYLAHWDEQWEEVMWAAEFAFPYVNKNFGPYTYKQYSFIQGGDGGMEYAMGTLLNGPGIGTVFHELMHNWYQMLLATNESLYPWMDEGFTVWATEKLQSEYRKAIRERDGITEPERNQPQSLPENHAGSYRNYFGIAQSGLEEPLTTHADHYNTNAAYGVASYSKGSVFLSQLGYITGDQVLAKIMLRYYDEWKFRHPNDNDFIRVAEKESKMKLDWYRLYWVNSTKQIDYGIDSIWAEGQKVNIRLRRVSEMPMPIDLYINLKDGSQEIAYIPQYLMFGEKPAENNLPRKTYEAWKWTHPTYVVTIDKNINDISSVEIDPTQRMADVNRKNNKVEFK